MFSMAQFFAMDYGFNLIQPDNIIILQSTVIGNEMCV